MSTPTIHFNDAARPDDEDVFPVYVYSDIIPRVGDSIHYHVDTPSYSFEGDEPGAIEGKVERVEIEYRRMKQDTVVMVSVWLSDYKVTPPTERQKGKW